MAITAKGKRNTDVKNKGNYWSSLISHNISVIEASLPAKSSHWLLPQPYYEANIKLWERTDETVSEPSQF